MKVEKIPAPFRYHLDKDSGIEASMDACSALSNALVKAKGALKIVQAITYLRDPADYVVVHDYYEQHYPDLPQLIVKAPVCRPGWLIETECIALTSQGDVRFRNY